MTDPRTVSNLHQSARHEYTPTLNDISALTKPAHQRNSEGFGHQSDLRLEESKEPDDQQWGRPSNPETLLAGHGQFMADAPYHARTNANVSLNEGEEDYPMALGATGSKGPFRVESNLKLMNRTQLTGKLQSANEDSLSAIDATQSAPYDLDPSQKAGIGFGDSVRNSTGLKDDHVKQEAQAIGGGGPILELSNNEDYPIGYRSGPPTNKQHQPPTPIRLPLANDGTSGVSNLNSQDLMNVPVNHQSQIYTTKEFNQSDDVDLGRGGLSISPSLSPEALTKVLQASQPVGAEETKEEFQNSLRSPFQGDQLKKFTFEAAQSQKVQPQKIIGLGPSLPGTAQAATPSGFPPPRPHLAHQQDPSFQVLNALGDHGGHKSQSILNERMPLGNVNPQLGDFQKSTGFAMTTPQALQPMQKPQHNDYEPNADGNIVGGYVLNNFITSEDGSGGPSQSHFQVPLGRDLHALKGGISKAHPRHIHPQATMIGSALGTGAGMTEDPLFNTTEANNIKSNFPSKIEVKSKRNVLANLLGGNKNKMSSEPTMSAVVNQQIELGGSTLDMNSQQQNHQSVFRQYQSNVSCNNVSADSFLTIKSKGSEARLIRKTPPPQTLKQYVDIEVFTMSKEDCQWGIFDFANAKIDPKSGKVHFKYENEEGKQNAQHERCSFSMKGTNYITRHSKYTMGQCLPHESSSNQIDMGSLCVLQTPQHYSIYQNMNLNLDFTKQIKRSDDFISQQLKDLSKKTFMVIASNAEVGQFSELKGMNEKQKVVKRGSVIRQGDIIKFGRVPILIKESSIDAKRWEILKKKEDEEDPNLDVSASNARLMDLEMNNSQFDNMSAANRRDLESESNFTVGQLRANSSRVVRQSSALNNLQNLGTEIDLNSTNNLHNLYMINQSMASLDENGPRRSAREPASANTQRNQDLAASSNRDIMRISNMSPSINLNLTDRRGRENSLLNQERMSGPAAAHLQSSLNAQNQNQIRIPSWCQQISARSLTNFPKVGNPNMLSSGLEVIKEEKRLNSMNKGGVSKTAEQIEKKKKKQADLQAARSCRICLCEETAPKEDPIISPCICKGSSGDIHLKCLHEWLNSKRKVNKLSAFQENYIYKKSQCEVCGMLYPDMIRLHGKLLPIFDFNKPKKSNYIIIEVLGMPAGKNFSVIKIPDNYQIEVGRSNAEMCIPDVSVSKKQATLKFDMSVGELVLTDSNSKYGTHIMIQRPIPLRLDRSLYVVNGLSLIRIELKKERKQLKDFCGCCLPKKEGHKYMEETQFMYNEVKQYMPSDLIKYEKEFFYQQSNKEFESNQVHLLPITEHSFYVREDEAPQVMSSRESSHGTMGDQQQQKKEKIAEQANLASAPIEKKKESKQEAKKSLTPVKTDDVKSTIKDSAVEEKKKDEPSEGEVIQKKLEQPERQVPTLEKSPQIEKGTKLIATPKKINNFTPYESSQLPPSSDNQVDQPPASGRNTGRPVVDASPYDGPMDNSYLPTAMKGQQIGIRNAAIQQTKTESSALINPIDLQSVSQNNHYYGDPAGVAGQAGFGRNNSIQQPSTQNQDDNPYAPSGVSPMHPESRMEKYSPQKFNSQQAYGRIGNLPPHPLGDPAKGGPGGVGKNEAAEQLEKELAGLKKNMSRDNSRNQVGVQNYQEKQEAQDSKIQIRSNLPKGAPLPGSVGGRPGAGQLGTGNGKTDVVDAHTFDMQSQGQNYTTFKSVEDPEDASSKAAVQRKMFRSQPEELPSHIHMEAEKHKHYATMGSENYEDVKAITEVRHGNLQFGQIDTQEDLAIIADRQGRSGLQYDQQTNKRNIRSPKFEVKESRPSEERVAEQDLPVMSSSNIQAAQDQPQLLIQIRARNEESEVEEEEEESEDESPSQTRSKHRMKAPASSSNQGSSEGSSSSNSSGEEEEEEEETSEYNGQRQDCVPDDSD